MGAQKVARLRLPPTSTPTHSHPDTRLLSFLLASFRSSSFCIHQKKVNMLTHTHACTTSAGIPTDRQGIAEAEQQLVMI